MMRGFHKSLLTALLSGSVLTLAACGGGGGGTSGGGTVTGLDMPTKLSIVTAQDGGSAKASGVALDYKALAGVVATTQIGTFSAGSDYNADTTQTYVYDPSMESLDTVNMILCLMDQTKAPDMVNEGAYIALVDEDKCEQGQNQSSAGSTGQSSGGKAKQYNKWTVQSTRADNSSPMIVKIWVPGKSNSTDTHDLENILVELTATEGVSASKPFGSFSMSFTGVVDTGLAGGGAASGTFAETMKGVLETVDNGQSQPQFRFFNVGGTAANPALTDFSFTQATNVVLDDATGTGGVAKTRSAYSDTWGSEDKTYVVAFDPLYLLRGKDDGATQTSVCTDRNSFGTQVWRYNLYHRDAGTFDGKAVTAGQRVALNSGFPFTYNTGTETVNGHASYWGLWVENDVAIPDQSTITKMDYSTSATAAYTVNVAPGKAIKRTAYPKALSEFEGSEFYAHMDHPDATLGWPGDGTNSYDSWLVQVQGGAFVVTHGVNWGDSGPTLTPITGVTSDTVTFSFEGENLRLWSDALGGNVVYTHSSTAPKVTFYAEEFVYPSNSALFPTGTATVTLYCYDRCPIGGLNQAAVDAMTSESDLFYPTDFDPSNGTTFHSYTLAIENGNIVLRDKVNAIVSADGLNLTSLGHDWGMQSGEMVEDTTGLDSNPWQIFEALTSYRWETGSNQWNKLVTVSTGGVVETFDKPLQFTYTVEAGDDANNDNNVGKTFLLQYGGPGELWGFPWQEDANGRWHSSVTLKNGVQLSSGTDNFVVKQIEREQTMSTLPDTTACTGSPSGLNVDTLYTDPNLALPTAADLGTVSFTWGSRPTVTDAPAVIEGELQ